MKKTIFVLLLILAALLTACDSPSNEPAESTSSIPPSTEPKIFIDPVPLIFYEEEYDAYLEHCRTDPKVPENFIHYDSLRELGSFYQFTCDLYYRDHGYPRYGYTVIDSFGNKIIVDASYEKQSPYSANIPAEAINPQDMRNLLDENAGYRYIHNGIVYSYRSGKLEDIRWEIDGVAFGFFPLSPQNFSEYPISDESPSIIQAFLSLDTADEAVARFAEMISQP